MTAPRPSARRTRLVAALTAAVLLSAVAVPTAAGADPVGASPSTGASSTSPTGPSSSPTPTPTATAGSTTASHAAPTPTRTPTTTVAATPTGPSQQATTFLAQLAALQTRALALQTELTTVQDTAGAALAAYDDTTHQVQAAVDAAQTARTALDVADQQVDAARRSVQLVARDAFIDSVPHTSSALLLTSDLSDLDFTVTALSYLASRTDASLGQLRGAEKNAAALAASEAAHLADAQTLQARADAQRAAALDALGQAQARQQAFAGQVDDLRLQAATAAVGASPADLPTYQAFLAGLSTLGQPGGGTPGTVPGGAPGTATGTPAGPLYVPGGPGLVPRPGTSWITPLVSYTMSSCYCVRGTEFHHGVDLAAPLGTPIYAVGAGTVVQAGPAQGFGNWVVVDHHDGSYSIYGHMKVLATTVGATVAAGTLVAYVGSEGESTGPHLHFEVRLGSYADPASSTDPVLWLARRGITL